MATPTPVAATQDDPIPSPEKILARYLKKLEDRGGELLLPKYTFEQATVVEQLGQNGETKKQETFRHVVVPIEGALFYRLVENDDEPLTTRETAKETKREKEFRRQRIRERKKPKKKPDNALTLDEDLLNRFDWLLDGTETLNGRPTYRLAFKPKRGKLIEKRRVDRVINKAIGKVWFDKEDGDVARIHLQLTEEINYWGGLLGKISGFNIQVDQRRTDEGDWMPIEQTVYLRGRFFIRSIHRRTRRRSKGFIRVPDDTQAAPNKTL